MNLEEEFDADEDHLSTSELRGFESDCYLG